MEPTINCYYYNKMKGNLFYAMSCFLGFSQRNNSLRYFILYLQTLITYLFQ
jgi:hypothetical protein